MLACELMLGRGTRCKDACVVKQSYFGGDAGDVARWGAPSGGRCWVGTFWGDSHARPSIVLKGGRALGLLERGGAPVLAGGLGPRSRDG